MRAADRPGAGGQSGERNALQIDRRSSRFDALVTCDQNVKYQQNLTRHRLSMVVLGSNIWPSVQTKLADIVLAVDRAKVGSFEFVEIPPPKKRRPVKGNF